MDTIIVPTSGPMPKHTHDALVGLFGAKTASNVLCNMSAAVARANYALRGTLCMQRPPGAPARRGPHVDALDEEDLDPKEGNVDLPPDNGEEDLDAREAPQASANPVDPILPIQVPAPVGTGVLPYGRHAD